MPNFPRGRPKNLRVVSHKLMLWEATVFVYQKKWVKKEPKVRTNSAVSSILLITTSIFYKEETRAGVLFTLKGPRPSHLYSSLV